MASDFILVVDRDLIIRHCSGDLEAGAGLQEGGLRGKQLSELFEAESCRLLKSWWSKGPFKRKAVTLRPLPGLLATTLAGTRWELNPLPEKGKSKPNIVILSYSVSADRLVDAEIGSEHPIKQLQAFGSVLIEALATEGKGESLQTYAEAIAKITDFSKVLIVIFPDETSDPRLIAHAGFIADEITRLRDNLISRDTLQKICLDPDLKRGSVCFSFPKKRTTNERNRVEAGKPKGGTLEIVERERLVIPLRYGEKLFGYLAAYHRDVGGAFSPNAVEILELMTVQIVLAVAKQEVEHVAEVRHKDLKLLHDVSRLINSSLDVDEVLTRLVSTIREQMGYSHVSLLILEDDVLVRKTYAGKTPRDGYERIEVGSGIIGRAVFKGKPYLVNDISKDRGYLPTVPGTKSKIAVPIKSSSMIEGLETESIIGVLNTESDIVNNFTTEDISRLEAIANTAAMAIENAHLMNKVLAFLQAEADHRLELEHKKSELDEFIYTISHDLKNPLNSIAGFAETLELELGQEQNVKIQLYLDRIRANVQLVSRMISDLLELSRVGRVDEEKMPIPLEKMIKEIQFDMRAAGEELTIRYDNLPATLVASRSRIRQLFTNLITNAVKYRHPDRTPEVNIAVHDRGDEYEFAISDNGIGIDEKYLESIFVFGFRLREIPAEGTGAGLAITKRIVESHGGRIWVDSQKGVGSIFHFTLPKERRF